MRERLLNLATWLDEQGRLFKDSTYHDDAEDVRDLLDRFTQDDVDVLSNVRRFLGHHESVAVESIMGRMRETLP